MRSHYFGEEVFQKIGVLESDWFIKRGIIDEWDEMEKVWSHTFNNELRCDPTEL